MNLDSKEKSITLEESQKLIIKLKDEVSLLLFTLFIFY